MLKVEIPDSPQKLRQQIEAVKYLIEHDTSEKDKSIHLETLAALEAAQIKKDPAK